MEEKLELRLYGLVNYQLTGIQKGIQFGHAALEYAHKYGKTKEYFDFIENYKTWIILGGGTTNSNPERLGTMNYHLETLKQIGIPYADFYEPDLGDQLTAIVFLVDERVFNTKIYPNFTQYLESKAVSINGFLNPLEYKDYYAGYYAEWLSIIGGEANAKLREFIQPFRLA